MKSEGISYLFCFVFVSSLQTADSFGAWKLVYEQNEQSLKDLPPGKASELLRDQCVLGSASATTTPDFL